MFSDVLKIIPKLDANALRQMEKQLGSRLTRVAKGFGKGILNVIKGGGVIAIAGALIDKLLNPLKEVQEAVDRTLKHSDDTVTNAGQFNTTAGKLSRLQTFAKVQGLDEGELALLLVKFQGAVAKAKADPSQPSAVSNFVNEQDTAEGFFKFIQGLQKVQDPNARFAAQAEVFGEKQVGKMAEFLQSDFGKLARVIGGPSAEELTLAHTKISDLEEKQRIIEARREDADVLTKAQLLNESLISQLESVKKANLNQENNRLGRVETLAGIERSMVQMSALLEKGYAELAPIITVGLPAIVKELTSLSKTLSVSRLIRLGLGIGKDK